MSARSMVSWVQTGISGVLKGQSQSSLITARKLEFAHQTGTIDIGGQLLNIYDPSAPPPGSKFMRVLIVEDEPDVAASLQALIEARGTHKVVAIAEDLDSAREQAEKTLPDVAFIDLQLANTSTGYEVATALGKMGIACIFQTGRPPPFQMPELAIACLEKPYGLDEVEAALQAAEEWLGTRLSNLH